MEVNLLNYTPIEIADIAIGKCWDKPKEQCDFDRIERVANKNKHSSTIEHLYYNFEIKGVSRALLQELARHRIASPSVKSTRYTLKELKESREPFITIEAREVEGRFISMEVITEYGRKFIVTTGNDFIDAASASQLDKLRDLLNTYNIANDKAKYMLPESYKTELVWSINARSLQNFLMLRTSRAALWEIKNLANLVYSKLPEEHQFLFKRVINDS